jgi:hypothetical protein
MKHAFAQDHCAVLDLRTNSEIPISIDFTFDNMSDYVSGKTIAGRVQLKIVATDGVISPPCIWGLKMRVENTGSLPVPALTDWANMVNYGLNGTVPPIDLLWARAYNACNTPINDVFVQFGPLPGEHKDEILIIDDIAAHVAVNPCPAALPLNNDQVNTAGSYLTNYSQFVFNIDFKVKPNLTLNNRPGKYELKVYFYLYER